MATTQKIKQGDDSRSSKTSRQGSQSSSDKKREEDKLGSSRKM